MTVPPFAGPTTVLPWRTVVVLWALFGAICSGLGYGALNRYDPTTTPALSDTRDYAELVVRDPGPEVNSHRSFRILIPVVFAVVMAGVWWWMAWRHSPQALRGALWIVAMGAASMGAVLLVRMAIAGAITTPLAIVASFEHRPRGLGGHVRFLLLDAEFWYGLVWLLPLGAWSLRRLPREWVISALAAAGVALALGVYAMAGGGNVSRPIISLAGPPLSLAAAITRVRQPGLKVASAPVEA
jgi:hypothetical protein